MTLVIKKPTSGKLVMAKTYVGIDDPDAASYIALVEAADTAAGSPGGLETATKVAIHSFVKGCKADGIWPALKACCILAGARTLNGALVPLVGVAPTRHGTEGGWNYNRETGLMGNGINNYINSGFLPTDLQSNNSHASVVASNLQTGTPVKVLLGSQASSVKNQTLSLLSNTQLLTEHRIPIAQNTLFNIANAAGYAGFIGSSRSASNLVTARIALANYTSSTASVAGTAFNYFVFGNNSNGTADGFTTARISFYSIGEYINLALLDARVTALITAFGAAIP